MGAGELHQVQSSPGSSVATVLAEPVWHPRSRLRNSAEKTRDRNRILHQHDYGYNNIWMLEFDKNSLGACGDDVVMDSMAFIRYPDACRIGMHVIIDGFVHISASVDVGNYVHIAPFVSVGGGRRARLEIGDFCGIAAGCRIICSTEDFLFGSGLTNPTIPDEYHGKIVNSTVTLEKHVLLGVNSVVFPGVKIGEGAVAAACTVVKKDMAPWTVYSGNPAVVVGPRRKDRILELEKRIRLLQRRLRAARQGDF